MRTDEALPIRSDFDIDDLGTLIVRPHPKTLETATADPLARIEQKLDAVMRRLDALEDTLRVVYEDRDNAPSR